MRHLRLIVIVFMGCFLAGCVTGHHRLYSEQNADPSQMAVIKGGDPLDLYEIDGKPGPNFGGAGAPKRYNSLWDRSFVVELPPGWHVFKVGFLESSYNTITSSAEPQIVYLEAQPGAVYLIEGIRSGSRWTPTVRKIK